VWVSLIERLRRAGWFFAMWGAAAQTPGDIFGQKMRHGAQGWLKVW